MLVYSSKEKVMAIPDLNVDPGHVISMLKSRMSDLMHNLVLTEAALEESLEREAALKEELEELKAEHEKTVEKAPAKGVVKAVAEKA
jgi:hypothetical protein